MAKRLIDATDAEKWAHEHILDAKERYTIVDFLRECSTVDAVEVVRCKDCKRCRINEFAKMSGMGFCRLTESGVRQDDFCSYGERR